MNGKYEIHLTFSTDVSDLAGWKSSLGEGVIYYLTTRAKTEDEAMDKIGKAHRALETRGDLQKLVREKVELIVYDRSF
jgi:hypothetical protein